MVYSNRSLIQEGETALAGVRAGLALTNPIIETMGAQTPAIVKRVHQALMARLPN